MNIKKNLYLLISHFFDIIANILESIHVEFKLRRKKNIIDFEYFFEIFKMFGIEEKYLSKWKKKKEKYSFEMMKRKEKVEDAGNFFEVFKMFGVRKRRRNIR